MTPYEEKLYNQWLAKRARLEEQGYPVNIYLRPEQWLEERKDLLSKRRSIIDARGGAKVRTVQQEMLDSITSVSKRSAIQVSRHAADYLKSLSPEQLDKLIAKSPDVAKFAKMSERQLKNYLLQGGRAARDEIFAALPSKKKKNKGGRGYHNVATWYNSP